ncbi:Phosphopantetheine attachment site [Pseudomonas sp. NFR09]|uniref:beta-ketoacyl synthase N-terminal-like domain-containing protein n=1 Tax=Pseudomonas sp. NFR09 TaxID=1566249 RepID=UPI0008CCCA33|nr:beta-ketoacyl synthase N-terminal-like domain-containing protein [Pseudomonas sp. NFR09]SET65108.1 Phosphopantetheine attachment site [Pseudomonas sp. NFR09]
MKKLHEEILRSFATGSLSKEGATYLLRVCARQRTAEEPIAVIGMAGRWPGAEDVDALWNVLRANEFQVRAFPESRRRTISPWLGADGATAFLPGAWLDEIDHFDADFFGIASRDAELIDPVQRLFLETSWLALRDAVGNPAQLRGQSVGVYAGCCPGSDDVNYWQLIQRHAPGAASVAFTGNLSSMLPGRVSHAFDLRGPSMVVDTACSSSLVAAHYACQALRAGECQLAIAGGVKLHLFPQVSDDQIGIESPDGLTRTFAGGPSGTGLGEGVGAVVLKPLSKALADGDRIYAVINGSACNQDGRTSGLTVPNVVSQQAVVESAWRAAGIGPQDIGCIEAHGTGTRLGDPIEFEALSRALQPLCDQTTRCALGSAKTVFGHLDSAAGITGLIKSVLMVQHRHIAPSLNFVSPNESIDYLASPLYVNDRLIPWPEKAGQQCGVSAFSMAGANCHIVVGPAPAHTPVERPKVGAEMTRRAFWFAYKPAPATSMEANVGKPDAAQDVVTRVWAELLGAGAAVEDADFFMSGGDSLKAAVLASRLARELGRKVSVSQLWRTPTLATLRAALQQASDSHQVALPHYEPADRYPLTPAQKHMMLHSMQHADTLYNVPFGLRLDGAVDVEKLCRRARAVAEADDGLRVRVAMQGGQAVMVPSMSQALEVDVVEAADDAALERLTLQFIRPFSLENGPLARLLLVRQSPTVTWLLMDFHHVVMDGISVALFVQRLEQACRTDDDYVLPPARTALDSAQWYAERVASAEFTRHRDFWTSRLAHRGSGMLAAFQAASPDETRGARLTLTLDAPTSLAVTNFARTSGVGLFATVLGAFTLALNAFSGQRAFNIGTPFSGRLGAGTEDVLGMFVNLLPMAMVVAPEAALNDWLATLRNNLAECMDVQEAPIDLIAPQPGPLREALGFNVVFALQNMALGAFELDQGVRATPIPFYDLPWNVAKFDLTLFAMEVGDRLVLSFERRVNGLSAAALSALAEQVVTLLSEFATPRVQQLSDCLALLAGVAAPQMHPVFHF